MELLTEAEWREVLLRWMNLDATYGAIEYLRERGFIAPPPAPVDPLLIEAREIAASYYEDNGFTNYVRQIREGYEDHGVGVRIALTAIRRNLELAERPTLTHHQAALLLCNAMADAEVENVSRYDLGPAGRTTNGNKIASALVERLK